MIINISKLDSDIIYEIYSKHCQIDNDDLSYKIDHKDFSKFLSNHLKELIASEISKPNNNNDDNDNDKEIIIINKFINNIIDYFYLIFNNNKLISCTPSNSSSSSSPSPSLSSSTIDNKIKNMQNNFKNITIATKSCNINNESHSIIRDLKDRIIQVFKLFLIYINDIIIINKIENIIKSSPLTLIINNNNNNNNQEESIFKNKIIEWLKLSFDNSILSSIEMYNRKELLLKYSTDKDSLETAISSENERVIKVYSNDGTGNLDESKYRYRFEVIDEYESFSHPMVYSVKSRWYNNSSFKRGDYSIVPNLEIFKKSFSLFTNDILDGLEWSSKNDNTRVLVYGGSVLCCLENYPKDIIKKYCEMLQIERIISKLPLPRYLSKMISRLVYQDYSFIKETLDKQSSLDSPYYRSDIDIALISTNLEQAKLKLKQVASKITNNLESRNQQYRLVRTPNSISIVSEGNRVVQLIIMFYKSIEEQILFHDMDCISTCYDGSNVYIHERTLRALNRRTNLISIKTLTSSHSRILKYSLRGFNCICFQLCDHIPRCDRKDQQFSISKSLNKATLEKQFQIQQNPTLIGKKDLLEYQSIDFPLLLNNNQDYRNNNSNEFNQIILKFLQDNLPGLYSESIDPLLEIESNQKTKFGILKSFQYKNNINNNQ